ncbi:MAG: histidine kinase [Bacteroidota bacterium]
MWSILFLLSGLPVAPLCAQGVAYQEITPADGLPNRSIYSILQQGDGTIIIGASKGLYAYDGQIFEPIPFIGKYKSHHILGLQMMADSSFSFINAAKHLFVYRGDSIKEVALKEAHFQSGGKVDKIHPYCANPEVLLIESGKKLFLLDWKQHTIQKELSFSRRIFAAGIDKEQRIWVSRLDSIIVYGQHGEVIRSYLPKYAHSGFSTRFFRTADGSLFYYHGQESVLSRMEIREGKIVPTDVLRLPTSQSLTHIGEDKSGNLLLTTHDGLFIFDGLKLRHLFEGETSNYAFSDREENLWVSIYPSKVRLTSNLETYAFSESQKTLPNNWIVQIEVLDSQQVVVRTHKGFIGIGNKEKLTFQQACQDPYERERIVKIGSDLYWSLPVTGLSACEPLSLIQSGGILDPSPYQIPQNTYNLHRLSDTLWLGDKQAKCVIKIAMNGFRGTIQDTLLPQLPNAIFYPERFSHDVWIGGYGGGFLLTQDSHFQETEHLLKHTYIRSFKQDDDSTIWALGFYDGLHQLKKDEHGKYFYQGLRFAVRYGEVFELIGDFIWIGTRRGLYKFDMRDGSHSRFQYQKELANSDITALKYFQNDLWVGTTDGLYVLPMREGDFDGFDPIPPKLKIKQVSIARRDTALHPRYRLPFDQNDLSVQLQAFAFRSGENYTYEHRMLGLDTVWETSSSSANVINYYDLKAGNYTFQARAKSSEGLYSTDTPEITFEIIPPYWEQTWFKLARLLSVIGLVGLLALIYLRRREKKAEMEKRVIMAELNSLKLQMNPHFLFNVMTSIQDFISQRDSETAISYLKETAHLMRMVLDASRKTSIYLEQEVKVLEKYMKLEQLRFQDTCIFEIQIDPSVEYEFVKVPPMLIQPFVENAIHHGFRGHKGTKQLTITYEWAGPAAISCTIVDNGVGRAHTMKHPQDPHHRSWGTTLIQSRLSLLQQQKFQKVSVQYEDLYDERGLATGTKVTVSIPCQYI